MSTQYTPLLIAALFCSPLVKAQQSQPRYTFKTIAVTDPLAHDAVIEGSALSDDGEAVFVVRWIESNRERTALFSSSRLIVKDGSRIDGRVVNRVLPTSLTINRAGTIGFEAIAGNANQIAVFVGNKFGAALAKGGDPNDFILSDDGQVILQGATLAASDQTQMANETSRMRWLRSLPATIGGPAIRRGQTAPIPIPDPTVLMVQHSAEA